MGATKRRNLMGGTWRQSGRIVNWCTSGSRKRVEERKHDAINTSDGKGRNMWRSRQRAWRERATESGRGGTSPTIEATLITTSSSGPGTQRQSQLFAKSHMGVPPAAVQLMVRALVCAPQSMKTSSTPRSSHAGSRDMNIRFSKGSVKQRSREPESGGAGGRTGREVNECSSLLALSRVLLSPQRADLLL